MYPAVETRLGINSAINMNRKYEGISNILWKLPLNFQQYYRELQGRLRAHRVIRKVLNLMRRPDIKIMLVLPPLVLRGGAVKNPWVNPATHGFSGLGTRPSQICWVGYPRPKHPG